MPKRKNTDEEKRLRKIRKLEKKLAKYRNEITEEDGVGPDEAENEETPAQPSNEEGDPSNEEGDPSNEEGDPSNEEGELEEPVIDTQPETEPALDTLDLPEDILQALGEDSNQEKEYGQEVHKDILKKMEGILLQGLSKEQKDVLLKTNLIPSNAKLLDAPRLNNELMSILNMNTKNRDKLLEGRQQELGVAIAGVIYSIDSLSKNDFDKLKIVKSLGEVSRLLCNLHNEYTVMRKKLISPHMDRNLSLNLKENIRSEFLYNKLEDTVKTISVMKRASNMLKPKNAQPKNYYQPPRRPYQGSQVRAPAARGGYQPRFQSAPAFRPPPRGPARRPPPAATQAPARGRAKYP